MAPALKLDRVAQLRAELEAGVAEAELLEREKLRSEDFREACAHWDAKLAEEAEHRRSVLTTRYNTAFNVKRRLLAAKRKPAEPEAVLEPAPRHAAEPPPVATSLTAAPPVAPLRANTFATPFPAPGAGVADSSFAGSSPALARAPEPALVAPRGDFSGTMISDEAGGGSLAEAMPFLRSLAQSSGIPLPTATSSSSRSLPGVDHGSTVTLDTPADAGAPSLPFLEAARAARATAKQAEPLPLPPPLPDYGGTLTLDPGGAEGAAALPFIAALREQRRQGEALAATATRRFSLEEFAALTAQIAMAPEAIAEVRRRWGLTEASHRSESEAWQQACAADPSLFERYTTLVKKLRAAATAGR